MSNSGSNRWMPTAGGILNIISGAFGILGSVVIFLMPIYFQALYDSAPETFDGLNEVIPTITVVLITIGVATIILSVLALIGGILALQRRRWGLALAGAICALFTSNITGIVALVFIAMSRKEFAGQANSSPDALQTPP
ncbi:MAG: hypothetical protein FWH51_06320 [Dehalococcoidia bacterium]|nr:hypothetical protein [Dehalococcoidia bacterium]